MSKNNKSVTKSELISDEDDRSVQEVIADLEYQRDAFEKMFDELKSRYDTEVREALENVLWFCDACLCEAHKERGVNRPCTSCSVKKALALLDTPKSHGRGSE